MHVTMIDPVACHQVLMTYFGKVFQAADQAPVAFVKTQNTVTVFRSQSGKRKVQVITRIFMSVDDIVNCFDIDCCCCGEIMVCRREFIITSDTLSGFSVPLSDPVDVFKFSVAPQRLTARRYT